jgi:hypothetical protein
MEAVQNFRDEQFDPQRIRRHAEEFDTSRFMDRLSRFVEAKIATHPVLARKAGLTYQGSDAAPLRDDMERTERAVEYSNTSREGQNAHGAESPSR